MSGDVLADCFMFQWEKLCEGQIVDQLRRERKTNCSPVPLHASRPSDLSGSLLSWHYTTTPCESREEEDVMVQILSLLCTIINVSRIKLQITYS